MAACARRAGPGREHPAGIPRQVGRTRRRVQELRVGRGPGKAGRGTAGRVKAKGKQGDSRGVFPARPGPTRAGCHGVGAVAGPGRAVPGAGDPSKLRGQASCGHCVSVAGLQGWVQALLDQGIPSFRCPDAPWLWQEVCKLGLFSDETRAMLETQILAQEGARASYRQCPRCQHLIQRLEPGLLRTPCLPCSQRARRLCCFCWGCRTDWSDLPTQSDSCSNSRCALQAALHAAPEIQAPDSAVHGCPLLRACPECHALLSHNGVGCPLVVCPECWLEFCYRCLRDHLGGNHEIETEQDEDEDLDYDSWEAGCTIAGRQELNASSPPPRETLDSPPENSPPAFSRPDHAPHPQPFSQFWGPPRA